MMTVSFNVGLLPNRPLNECIEMGIIAERLGFDGIWVADSHSVMRDPYAILNVLAIKTEKLKLATGVTHTVTRHPAVLANSWATLHELSGGREILGIGVGESAVHNLGLKPERLVVFEEKLNTIRALIKGEKVEYQGRQIHMPWSNYNTPIFMACSGPKSLQLGGRIADGILYQVGADPSFHRYALDNIRKGAQAAGRKLDDIKLYARLACAISNDREMAREEVKGYCSIAAGTTFKTVPREYFSDDLYQQLSNFKANYDYAEHGSNQAKHKALLTDDIVDAIAFAGTPEEVLPRFKALLAMGVQGFVLPFSMSDAIPYMETFAKEVIQQINVG
ncbi:MAG: LLM class flavin-dependent oxidoreductase [Pseudomonadales bacterium]